MKKILNNKKILVIIIIGIIVLSGITYVAAQTLINSKDVIYTDKSELNASNVQDAIDGTCSKIDTRLSAIEDKLYTVKNISVSKYIDAQATLSYTGLSVTVPANSYCSLSGQAIYYRHVPYRVSLNRDSTYYNSTYSYADYDETHEGATYISTTYSFYTDTEITIYLWAKYSQNQSSEKEMVSISGFCATKYKN